MYIGRFVVVGPGVGAYRVSSRSFPNRKIVERGGTLTVVPTADAAETDNPYVSYNCVRAVERGATAKGAETGTGTTADANTDPRHVVVGNGSHVDPVAEKVELGYPARDALAESLLALDYEKDDYDTPRIAGVVERETATVGIVRRDALLVETVAEPTLVATYEEDRPRAFTFDADAADDAARAAYGADFEHAVCAAGVTVGDDGVETAVENGE